MIFPPKLEPCQEQRYIAVRTSLPIPFGKYLPPLWNEVSRWLKSKGIASTGPAMIRYLTTDMTKKLDVDVGFVVPDAIPGDDRITADMLPEGRYAVLLYTGPYRGKGIYKATVALLDWAKKNHIVWEIDIKDQIEWWNGRTEFYLTDMAQEKDTKKYQTELAFRVK